jgi:DNA-binding CsgD family transcriptional regulator
MDWWIVITLLMAMVVVLRLYSAALCARMAWRSDIPPVTKQLCWALTAIQIASLISFLGRLSSHLHSRPEWETRPKSGLFLTGQLLSVAIAAIGILVVLWLVKRVLRSLSKSERIARILITSPLVDTRTSDLGLTAREVEVVEVMVEGNLSDQEIADALHITPLTAATHVRNILRKAELHNRRDLLFFYGGVKNELGR